MHVTIFPLSSSYLPVIYKRTSASFLRVILARIFTLLIALKEDEKQHKEVITTPSTHNLHHNNSITTTESNSTNSQTSITTTESNSTN